MRLEGLRADGPESLRALLAQAGDPPWDADVADDDPVRALLAAEGFEPYARVAVMARAVEGLPAPPYVSGVSVEPYRNEWAEAFTAAEAMAMDGLATFAEMGQPTGYEAAEGFDAFAVARDRRDMLGFAQAMVPEGWINWMGVVPQARRRGIGRLLIADLARQVREARGTHLAALVEVDTPGQAFLAALGFRERGARRTLLIRRA
ncbi:GNAT family N-acetyltransferase [Miltoncostaea marina]|uniref:GNAT family N-acetyltransferase n=1 Tax=Miltoncostaea marina TaxID=2843215 RepID=UPI001C3CD28E|nr:GNAT family N-acetyltransferase [Miltoncostaea marina]